MKRLSLHTCAGLAALSVLAISIGASPADAQTACKFVAKKVTKNVTQKVAKRIKGSHYAQRIKGLRTAGNPWHGWAGSFHLDGARYPGGNPSGPASYYNNYEGGFHRTVFWTLSDRGRF